MSTYPVRVTGRRDAQLSRWLWLAKWLLAIPHYVILAVLWLGALLATVAAYGAIILTGRYPRALFDYVVGVMRWTWRVQHYAYAALGTDRYPPFTLQDVPDYPARLEIDHPPRLSRGQALVKWWLLAIPHYLVLAFFLGGAVLAVGDVDLRGLPWVSGGLVGVLVLVAGVVLTMTGRYPAPIYDMVVGMDRWAIRVAAYVLGMTDVYPPFRFDLGGNEPAADTRPVGSGPRTALAMASPTPTAESTRTPQGAAAGDNEGWTTGRMVALLAGSVLLVCSLGAVVTGGVLTWADQTQRDAAGYLTADDERLSTSGYAIAGPHVVAHRGLAWAAEAVGTVRIQVTPTDPARAVFLGVADADAVDAYLADVPHVVAHQLGGHERPEEVAGRNAVAAPAATGIWTTSSAGTGTQTVFVDADAKDWTVVALNADGSAGVDLTAEVGARIPALPWLAGGLLGGGGAVLVFSVIVMAVAASRASRDQVEDSAARTPQPVA